MVKQMPQSRPLFRVQTWSGGDPVPHSAESLLGSPWPLAAGNAARGRADIVCISPVEWLVIGAEEEGSAPLLAALHEALQGSAFRVTEFSAGLQFIRIEGAQARWLLSKACALDVDSDDLAPGRAPRTLLAGLPAVIHCLDMTVFECIVPSSYVDYVTTWLSDADAELAPAPA
jgi:heterotetrameric sarcosine oxidase gamma subunit